ncbi:arylsulfatase [Algoriphagus jejuensis]|uniref:Arylsulfatase n=1 Tax=Algoriphagus jejuensis TaxID=419934 RepID=A0ABN1N0G8_9BACT
MKASLIFVLATVGFINTACQNSTPLQSAKPNIVIIYADDMGYGDLAIQNPESKIPTPFLDQMAREGMRFTDAHSSSGICSPSRYALLTGTYHWRRQHDIVNSFGKPFFAEGDISIGDVLRTSGYQTAAIGKWHLGWDWELKGAPTGEVTSGTKTVKVVGPNDIDWSQPIKGGPTARGFDTYFGDGTINFPPYVWVENDRVTEVPTELMTYDNIGFETKEGEWEFRPGPKVKGWNPYEVLPTLTKKAVSYIKDQTADQPFFLYFALPSPHAPIIPSEEFDGKSQAGAYGDFMVQTDWVAGQVLQALKDQGLEENTIVIFTADNGTEAYAWPRALKYGHFSMGDFRGLKRDVWEGGHHIPFIVKWPGQIPAGSVSDQLLSQIDIMATVAALSGSEMPEKAAPDSYDFSQVWLGQPSDKPVREALVHNTNAKIWGIRKGDWLYINDSTGGLRKIPADFNELRGYTDFDTPGLLFNIKEDSGQRQNLYTSDSEKVSELAELLEKYRSGMSTAK